MSQIHAGVAANPIRPGLNEPGAYAPGRGGGAGGEIQLAKDVGQVPVCGVLAQEKLLGDVGVAQSLRDELEHVQFARREHRRGRTGEGGVRFASEHVRG